MNRKMSAQMIFYSALDSARFTVALSADNMIQHNTDPTQISSATDNIKLMLRIEGSH